MTDAKDTEDFALSHQSLSITSQRKRLWKPLCNLDLIFPPVDVSVFFCYKKPHQSVNGGEVVRNSVGEPELLCNNPGVDFMEAYANAKLQDLSLYNPNNSIEGKLVPKKQCGALCVQVVIELKCGGVVVGYTFHHQIADAYSASMFLVNFMG
ncbi:hypothetical protein VitviT2T_013913 [Vitis vinifera]|uniref:Uncharacterized protein n=1 Tax=Vitis vinifera TaxID=29760 RepID=A0ABY9CKM0_VITVI|nr:hypothetical protein VitviT2T_013913 [Vitis vinifera]